MVISTTEGSTPLTTCTYALCSDCRSDDGGADDASDDGVSADALAFAAFEEPLAPALVEDDVQPATSNAVAAIIVAAVNPRRAEAAGMINPSCFDEQLL